MRVIFMGTPDFAVRALTAIMDSPHEVVAVYTQPPRPSGRGQAEKRSPIHELALKLDIPVHTPKSLRGVDAQKEFSDVVASTGADIAVVVAYGLILPAPVLEMPPKGCINIHGSLLPRWRGAAPIHRAILAGDTKSGITIMQMDEGLDTGAILNVRTLPIADDATAADLHDALANLGAAMIVSTLSGLADGSLTARPQPAAGTTYAKKIDKGDGRLDWTKPARALDRAIRAFTPWPGAWFSHDGARIKILRAVPLDGVEAAPGEAVDDALTIACGDGALRLLRMQREGRKPADAGDFLRGYPIPKGTVLTGAPPT